MSKCLGLGTAALVILAVTNVSAQPFREQPDGPRPPAITREDATAFLEARIAALHSGLQLTPEQERLWPAFERAYRERARLRMERLERLFAGRQEGRGEGREQPRADDPAARLQRRADALLREGAVLKMLADATAPLWQSFDDGQKRRFTILSRPNIMQGFLDRRDDRFGTRGLPGRDGDRFGEGRERRGFGPGGPGGRDGERFGSGREGRGFGLGPPRGRDDEFGPDRDPRVIPRRPDRDYGRDFGREGRGQFRWWHRPGEGGGRWRTGSMMDEDDVVGTVAVGDYGYDGRFGFSDDEDDEL
jgi:LTXXQ motif family protein